jgi:hypothetical protein
MSSNHIVELLEEYALDALDLDERAEVERHLQECPECRQVARELLDLASLLPQALAEASTLRPPAAMKERLLASLATGLDPAAKPGPGEERPAEARQAATAPPLPQATTSADGGPGTTKRRQSVWQWLVGGRPRAVGILAGLLLLVLLVFLGMQLSIALAQERALRLELANLFGQQEVVLEVVDSDKTVKRVLLAPEPRRSQPLPPYGKLFTRSDLPHVVAMVARLPQPPAGQAYHLWLTRQGQIELAGLMEVNDQGFSLLAFDADTDGPVYEAAQITLQPVGSTTPSGEPILEWAAAP